MPEPGPLERIARKEQEVRARVLVSRALAEAIVTDAEREAAALLSAADERGETEAQDLLQRELAAARASADRLLADAAAGSDRISADTAAAARAVELVVDAVLPRHPIPSPSADLPAGGR